jgi:hypothetical protein
LSGIRKSSMFIDVSDVESKWGSAWQKLISRLWKTNISWQRYVFILAYLLARIPN